ncbi:MAG: AraC family transcriptional regulator [Hyphomonadaceae bacterium]|nr:AraC family transcriptional regulator [Hyphomonadaceae bacterium]
MRERPIRLSRAPRALNGMSTSHRVADTDTISVITQRYMLALGQLRLEGVAYERFQHANSWKCTFDASGDSLLISPRRECMWIKAKAGDDPIHVRPGDLILFLDRLSVVAASDPSLLSDETPATPFALQPVSASQQIDLLIGHAHRDSSFVASAAPPIVHLPHAVRQHHPRPFAIAELLALTPTHTNLATDQPVLRRLTESLAIEIAAYLLATVEEPQRWMAGFADRHVAKALALLHSDVQTDWTLASLASAVGLSRSVFAQRFHELTGVPPTRYLRQVRLHQATVLLRDDKLSLGRISMMIGYQSEAAFNKAFLREFGVTPGRYRTRQRAPLSLS